MNLVDLAHVITKHEGALRASLQAEYRIRLLPGQGGRTEPSRTPRELADLVENLPLGCALWRAMGGAPALTDESHLLREAVYRLEILDWRETGQQGAPPKRIELPPAAGEVEAVQEKQNAKARAYAERQARAQSRG